jgi:uncharacterized RDD family membrane protein YckC
MPADPDPPLPPDVHFVVDAADLGPLGSDQVMRLVADGRIGPKTLAWHPALDQWTEVEYLPELNWLIQSGGPIAVAPPTPVLAGLGARVAAGVVDIVLWLGIAIGTAAAFGYWPALAGPQNDPDFDRWFDLLAEFGAAVYFIIPMSRIGGGATPGYRLFRLRLVVEPSLQPPDLLRTLVWYIVTFGRVIGWLTYFVDSKRRMLHNLVSNTLVIVVPRMRNS